MHGDWIWRLGKGYYKGAFKTDGLSGLAKGDVKYVRKDILQLF